MGVEHARIQVAPHAGLVLLAGALLAGGVAAQHDSRREEPVLLEEPIVRDGAPAVDRPGRAGRQDSRRRHGRDLSPARIEELLERVELGLSALEELGDEEGAAVLRRAARELRARRHADGRRDRPRARDGAPALEDLGVRLRILKRARAVLAEAGWEGAEAGLAKALEWGELSLSGASPEALEKAAVEVPPRAKLIEWLEQAARLHGERGKNEAAAGCRRLAEYYARLERGDSAGEDRGREREPRGLDLREKEQRVRVLELARDGFVEAGEEEWARVFERFARLGRLQLRGGSEEEQRAAIAGMSADAMGRVVEGLRRISGWFLEKGAEDRARACAALARFYETRDRGPLPEGRRETVRRFMPESRLELEREVERLRAQIQELRARLTKLEGKGTR